jgi:hypothetical protein
MREPACGHCGGLLTRYNATIRPELFLHDCCLAAVGIHTVQQEVEPVATGNITWMPTPLRTPACVQLANGRWCQLMREFRCGDETEWRAVEEFKL